MAKHIGIVAATAEAAASCYRRICRESSRVLGEHTHPEISIHNFSFADYMNRVWQEDWEGASQKMLASANKLVDGGAEVLVCPCNTLIPALHEIRERGPAPWISMVDVVVAEARGQRYKKLGLIGTRYVIEAGVYSAALEAVGIDCESPTEAECNRADRVIFVELVDGVVTDDAKNTFQELIQKMADRGCEAVVLACAEASELIRPGEMSIPTLDSNRLLARAALAASLE